MIDRNPITDPHYGFALKAKRRTPPIEVDPREWARRTQTKGYIARIKRSVQLVDSYLLACRGRARGLSGHQVDACHWFADPFGHDSERRTRRSSVTPANVLT